MTNPVNLRRRLKRALALASDPREAARLQAKLTATYSAQGAVVTFRLPAGLHALLQESAVGDETAGGAARRIVIEALRGRENKC